jgi:hypothetical protein
VAAYKVAKADLLATVPDITKVSLVNASSQVVAGTNYDLFMKATFTNDSTATYEAIVLTPLGGGEPTVTSLTQVTKPKGASPPAPAPITGITGGYQPVTNSDPGVQKAFAVASDAVRSYRLSLLELLVTKTEYTGLPSSITPMPTTSLAIKLAPCIFYTHYPPMNGLHPSKTLRPIPYKLQIESQTLGGIPPTVTLDQAFQQVVAGVNYKLLMTSQLATDTPIKWEAVVFQPLDAAQPDTLTSLVDLSTVPVPAPAIKPKPVNPKPAPAPAPVLPIAPVFPVFPIATVPVAAPVPVPAPVVAPIVKAPVVVAVSVPVPAPAPALSAGVAVKGGMAMVAGVLAVVAWV